MSNPFETLGLQPWADADEIRRTYRRLVKQCHPDTVQDPEAKQLAQERMVRLNLAYEEALRLARPRRVSPPKRETTCGEAILSAQKLLERGNAAGALRQLLRTEERSAAWYDLQGRILMAMEEYESAHQSFREAIRRDPDNYAIREEALDAVLALRREQTLPGRVKKFWKGITHHG